MVLLSICIPTYNRAKYLDITLNKITQEDIFLNTDKIIKKALETKGPVLVEVMIDPMRLIIRKSPLNALRTVTLNPNRCITCGHF